MGKRRRSFLFGGLSLFFLTSRVIAQPVLAPIHPKFILFDVFGTCLEIRDSLIDSGNQWSQTRGVSIDWSPLVDDWVSDHVARVDAILEGQAPWTSIDAIHREALPGLLRRYAPGTTFTRADREQINRFWHRLAPWPDAKAGLELMHSRFTLTAFTNANDTLLADLSRFAGFPWDRDISAQSARRYKPDPAFYRYAAQTLNARPDELLLVAAHPYDLRAAKRQGWRTALVIRPGETDDIDPRVAEREFDVVAKDFLDLDRRLGLSPSLTADALTLRIPN